MHLLFVVAVVGCMFNPLDMGAKNLDEYNKLFDQQFRKPVIEAVYENFNQ